jgi:hypothetical protein
VVAVAVRAPEELEAQVEVVLGEATVLELPEP